MKFGQAISHCFKHYADGQGRASRSEYWYWVLFTVLVSAALGFIDNALFPSTGGISRTGPVAGIFSLATLVPSICVAVRRLHDTGRSGWWQLIAITVVGIIPLLIWYCTPGKPGENKFGRNPLDPALEEVF